MKQSSFNQFKTNSIFVYSFTILFFVFVTVQFCQSSKNPINKNVGWEQLPKILKNIKAPVFPAKNFDVTKFGAVADENFDSRPAIQKAISECSKTGGGRVVVPKGNYFVKGPIKLMNNVNLHLEDGVVIKFSTNPDDYLPVVFTRWEGIECYNYSALIYANGQKNIAVTGKGTFDGQATYSNWWSWKGGRPVNKDEKKLSQLDPIGRPLLVKMNTEKTPVQNRIFGKRHFLRPNFVQLLKCKNILLEDVTFLNSPMWVLHPLLSQNVTIKNVSTIGEGPNTDGCDPESCKDVLIKNCFFKNGDDCIAIKSGRNNDGRRVNVPSKNIIVQDCHMKDGHGGVSIGSEVSGGCKNVFVENCEMDSPKLDRAIRVKANTFRGGWIENLFVRNITVGEVGDAVIHFDMKYEPKEGKDGGFLPVWKNIDIRNVSSKKSNQAFYMVGLENSKIKNISIENCNFDGVAKDATIENVKKLSLKNVFVNGKLFTMEKDQ